VPALHQAKQIVQTLLDSGYGKTRLRLVLNRVPKRVDVTPEELEKMLGLPTFAMLPNDYPALYDCYSEGKLLPRNCNLGMHLARLAAKVAGGTMEPPKKRFSLFG
jgi:Flp pilus assembly CpaE family ATPase